jgi:hypothetical protein
MDESAYFVTTLGVATTVLALGGASVSMGLTAVVLFVSALLLLLAGSLLYFLSKKRVQGTVVLLSALVLFAVSWLPWYGRHEGEAGMGYHRHTMWQLGHVH